MTPTSSGFLNPDPQIVDGVDVDAVVAAVRSCAGVDNLAAGQLGSVASYLPGRSVPGVRVGAESVTVQVRTRWAVPLTDVGTQLRAAVIPVISGRRLDIVFSDIAEPPASPPPALPAGPSEQETATWTTTSGGVAVTSSAPTIPTAAVAPTSLSLASPPSSNPDS